MSMLPEYRQITKKELESFKLLILPDIYEELCDQEGIDTEYICIASWLNDMPVGAIIADPEGSGDINLLSVWTVPEYRHMGIASALLDKTLQVAAALFDYEEGQYGDDITLKTMYCMEDEYRKPFPGNLPNPGIEPVASLTSPALAGGFFTTSTTCEAPSITIWYVK